MKRRVSLRYVFLFCLMRDFCRSQNYLKYGARFCSTYYLAVSILNGSFVGLREDTPVGCRSLFSKEIFI